MLLHGDAKYFPDIPAAKFRKYKDTTEPWHQVFTTRQIALTKRRGAQYPGFRVRHPSDWQSVPVQMAHERGASHLDRLLREDMPPMFIDRRSERVDKFGMIGEVADL